MPHPGAQGIPRWPDAPDPPIIGHMTQHETPDPADEATADRSPDTDEALSTTPSGDGEIDGTTPAAPGGDTTPSAPGDTAPSTDADTAPSGDTTPSTPGDTIPSGGDDPAHSDDTSETPVGGAPPPPPPTGPPFGPPPHDLPPRDPPPPPHGPQPGWGTWSPPPLRTLSRRSDDRVLCGVASGLGDYFNVDPAIFRLVFVGLTFFGGAGFMLYGLGWLFLPDRATGHSIGEDVVHRFGGPRSVATWIAAGIGVLMLINASNIFDADLLWAAVLIGVGVLFFRREDRPGTGEPDRVGDVPPSAVVTPQSAPYSAPPRERATAPPRGPSHLGTDPETLTPRSTIDDGWRPTPFVPPPSPPPPPSALGRITVAAALIVCGFLALLHTFTAFDVPISYYAALALIVVGAGLLVGARYGRSRGLIVLGLVLLAAVMISVPARNYPLFDGIGERTWQPSTVAELRDTYDLGMGQLTIDLSQLALEPGDDITVESTVGIGQLEIDVPRDATVSVIATGNGSASVFNRSSDGTNYELAHTRDGPEGSPSIELVLSTGLGNIDVQDGGASAASPPLAPPGVN